MSIAAVLHDARYAVRRLARDWRFTTAAILILGLGLGANTAIFSLINATLFRPQPFSDPDRLVDIYQNGTNAGGVDGNSYPAYLDMAAYTDVFAGTTAAFVPHGVNYMDDGVLRPAIVEHTTATYLSVLGLRPSLGRWFDAAEDTPGAVMAAVLGHEAWTRKFHADPAVIGRSIRIEGVPATIVGVGPAGHRGTVNLGVVTDFWLPISSLRALGAPPQALERRPEEAALMVKARLRDGVSVAQAQAAMNILGARLAAEYPKEDPGKGITVFRSSDVRIHPQLDGVLAAVASLLLVVVGLVLAIACSNLATLLLVRGTARAKEVSVRLALGATRGQLVRHLLAESLLLSAAGCITGCVLAWWAIRSLGALDLGIVVDLNLDYRVLIFAAAISLVTGVAFGLAPALKATRIELVPTLRGDGETRSPEHRWLTLKNALVVCQVALSVALLGGTSIVLQVVSASQTQRAGFAVDGVAMLQTDARYAGYSGDAAGNVYEELRRRISMIPGVQSAVLTQGMPMEVTGMPIVVEGAAAGLDTRARFAGAIWAGPGYFDLLRIPILFGRAFDERDRRGRRGDQRDDGAAVLRRRQCRRRRRTPFQARAGCWRERLDRGDRPGARHRDRRSAERSGRSDPAVVLSIVRSVGRAADDGDGADVARCGWTRRRHAARTAHGERRVTGHLRDDDGAVSRKIAGDAEGRGDVPRRPRSARPVPRRHRALCRRGFCGVTTVARNRNPHGTGCSKPAGGVDGSQGGRCARRRRDRPRAGAGPDRDPGPAGRRHAGARHLAVSAHRGSVGAVFDRRLHGGGGRGRRLGPCMARGQDRSLDVAPPRLSSPRGPLWLRFQRRRKPPAVTLRVPCSVFTLAVRLIDWLAVDAGAR
jgi:predicted permease